MASHRHRHHDSAEGEEEEEGEEGEYDRGVVEEGDFELMPPRETHGSYDAISSHKDSITSTDVLMAIEEQEEGPSAPAVQRVSSSSSSSRPRASSRYGSWKFSRRTFTQFNFRSRSSQVKVVVICME